MTKQKQETENRNFILSGKVFWAHVRKPNDLSGKYQVDLSIDDKTAKMLDEKGINVKEESNEKYLGTENDRGKYVTLTKNTTFGNGGNASAPLVVDGKKNTVPEDVKIGNGSLVNVQTSVYEWNFKGKRGKSLNLGPIQLKTLVKFESKALDAFPEEDYVHATTSNLDDSTEDDGECPFN